MKKGKILLSGLLSIAAFSIFTNVNAESYVVSEAPETFTTKAPGRVTETDAYGNTSNDAVLVNPTIAAKVRDGDGQNVIDYHTTDNKKPFCIERKVPYPFAGGVVYNRVGPVDDQVLAYIVGLSDSFYESNLASTAVQQNSELAVTKQMEQSWLTQVAIWKYNSTKATSDNPDAFATWTIADGDSIIEDRVNVSGDYYYYSKRAGTIWKKADELIAQAKTAAVQTSFQFSFAGSYELDEDAKTIKTGIITSPYANFGLDLSNAPEGTKVYDESGNELDSTNITTTKFYLVFPIENTEEYSFDFNVSATTKNVGGYVGYKYTSSAGNYQTMMLVTPKSITGGIHFEGSHFDDTASMVSRSIYFVGFLILIAGVAMIYVNVRPRATKEQI